MKKMLWATGRGISICVLSSVLLFSGCGDDAPEPKATTIIPGDLVLNGGGDRHQLRISSGEHWRVEIPEADRDWLSAEPSEGYGDAVVELRSERNFDVGRIASLYLRTSSGSIPLSLRVDRVSFLLDNFDAKKAPLNFPYPTVAQFAGWQAGGPGGKTVSYGGDNTFVTSADPSSGYDRASGGNNILFGAGGRFVVENIDLSAKADTYYILTFGCAKISEGVYADFDESELAVSVSFDGLDYAPVDYLVEPGTQGWHTGSAVFNLYAADHLYVRFASASGGMRIDDLRIRESDDTPQTGVLIVGTSDPSAVEYATATLNGKWLYTGTGAIARTGFEYRHEDDPGFTTVDCASTGSPFTYGLTGLDEGSTYIYKAFAQTAEGMVYGSEKSFITKIDPEAIDIPTVRGAYDGSSAKLPARWVINGLVVSDYAAGGAWKTAFAVVDGQSPGSGIVIATLSADGTPVEHRIAVGSEVSIPLTGARYAVGSPLRIDLPLAKITVSGTATVSPVTLPNLSDITDYESMLVRVADAEAQAKEILRPWGRAQNEASDRVSRIEMSTAQGSFVVSVSPDAPQSLRLAQVGAGSGSVTGIVGPDAEIAPRSLDDLALANQTRRIPVREKVVFHESFGTGSGNLDYAQVTNLDKTGQPDVEYYSNNGAKGIRNSSNISAGYTGASGGNHAYTNNDEGSFGYRLIRISKLNTESGGAMRITFGVSVTNNSTSTTHTLALLNANLGLYCSVDEGDSWTQLGLTLLEPNSGEYFALAGVDPTYILPQSSNLWIDWRYKAGLANCRMDDVKIITYEDDL